MGARVIRINPADNVAVAIEEIDEGHLIDGPSGETLTARSGIPRNHKVALVEIPAGTRVIRYGEPIGRAKERIQPGEWVHTHNLAAERT